MENYNVKYQGYELKYYFEPDFKSDEQLDQIMNDLKSINKNSRRNLEYGIFESSLSNEEIKDFLKKTILCIMYIDKEPVGFFYQVILQKEPTPIVHLGLVLIFKNKGTDIMAYSYRYSIMKIYQKYGKCYITNISAVPSIIGTVTDLYQKVWPSHNSQIRNPYKHYNNVVNILIEKYAKKVFPNPDLIKFDKHRYVLQLNSRECGFEDNFYKLPKFNNMPVNIFCYTWIDYNNGEEIIQVGELNLLSYIKAFLNSLI